VFKQAFGFGLNEKVAMRNLFFQRVALVLAGCASAVGCTSSATVSRATFAASPPQLSVCSGYGCILKDTFSFSIPEIEELGLILAQGASSPEAERGAVGKAIGRMEQMARGHLRYRPDVKKSYQKHAGKRGQMDCVDESLNTTGYLRFLHSKGFLKHHKPRRRYAERGLLVDGRYPHKSAVMIDAAGAQWTVDSWYDGDGSAARIMPLGAWKKVRDSFS